MLLRCSFLLLFLGVSTIADELCQSSSLDCECYGTPLEAEYNCKGEYTIKVISKYDRVEIDCNNYHKEPSTNKINWDTVNLPTLNLGNITFIRFRRCRLPKSFRQILNDLKIESIKTLHIDYSDDFENITVTSDYFQGLSGLEKLKLPTNNIKYIDKNVFNELRDLTDINLNFNNVQLTDYIFQHTRNLRSLDLSTNNLDRIPDNVFENLINLKYLYLHSNNLIYINSESFKSLNNLEILELSSNHISNISEFSFNGLTSLQKINLSRNKFQNLPGDLFKKNFKLEIVKIDRNPLLTSLPEYLFANLTNLKEIYVQQCTLTVLPENLFVGDVNLKIVSFARNNLQRLPDKFFENLEKLGTLDLSFNNLTDFPIDLFEPLTQLKVLNLNNNNIEKLNKNIFKKLFSLEVINLKNNHIEIIDRELLRNSEALKDIILSNNRLSIPYNFRKDGFISPFNENINIEKLDLSNNRITEISTDWIIVDVNLKELNLSHNQINSINFDDIFAISPDLTIDLTYNNISWVDFTNAEERVAHEDNQDVYNYRLTKGVVVYLDNNPINCNCFLYDFVRYFERSVDPLVPAYVTIKANNLTCASPTNFIGFDVKKLQSHMVKCTFEQLQVAPCSEICDCDFRPWDRAILINCSNRNLTEIPKLSLPIEDFYNQTHINLKNNLLTSAPVPGMGYENVTKMDLSCSHISQFTWLPSKLERLLLDNNNINHVDFDMLTMLNSSRLTDISLGGNPYIITNLSKEIDVSNIKCRNGGNNLVRSTIHSQYPKLSCTLVVVFWYLQ